METKCTKCGRMWDSAADIIADLFGPEIAAQAAIDTMCPECGAADTAQRHAKTRYEIKHQRINVAIDSYLDEHGDEAAFRVWETSDGYVYCTAPTIIEPKSSRRIYVDFDGDEWIEIDINPEA